MVMSVAIFIAHLCPHLVKLHHIKPQSSHLTDGHCTPFIMNIGWIVVSFPLLQQRAKYFLNRRRSYVPMMINNVWEWYRWRKTWTATITPPIGVSECVWESERGENVLISLEPRTFGAEVDRYQPNYCTLNWLCPLCSTNEWSFVNLCNTNGTNTVQHVFSVDSCIEIFPWVWNGLWSVQAQFKAS